MRLVHGLGAFLLLTVGLHAAPTMAEVRVNSLCSGGPFESRDTKIQTFSQTFTVPAEAVSTPITLQFVNGPGQKFQWVRAYLNAGTASGARAIGGHMIVNEQMFRGTNTA